MIDRFLKLFEGSDTGHGEFDAAPVDTSVKVQGVARTYKGHATAEMWQAHLEGTKGLGVIPIKSDNTCRWGCIDIDSYSGFDHKALCDKISKHGFPLIVCRSKSGGAHVFLFCQGFQPATKVRAFLAKCASALGHGKAEIFPKQDQVIAERGDMGNWLNMPYFGGDASVRRAVDPSTGELLPMSAFLDMAMSFAIPSPPEPVVDPKAEKGPFSDGPPCLEQLTKQGIPEGGRNNSLFQVGVYCKKKWPDDWARRFEEMASKLCPDLPLKEILEIQGSLKKKEYFYRCDQEPCASFCDKRLCRRRALGIESRSSNVVIDSLTKIDSEPPIWFANVEGYRIELETDDLQNQRKFQKKCMDKFNFMPGVVKDSSWTNMVNRVMENVEIQQAPSGVNLGDRFTELLEEFCVNKKTMERRDLERGRVFYCDDGFIYFRSRALEIYLDRNEYDILTATQVFLRLRDMGGKASTMRVGNKRLNLYALPDKIFESETELEIPDMGEEGAM